MFARFNVSLRRLLWCTAFVLSAATFIPSARADVIVLANRTSVPVPCRFVPVTGEAQQLALAAGETMPLYLDGKADVTFASRSGPKLYTLDANCAYYFGRDAKGLIDLHKIGLGEDGTAAEGRKMPGRASRAPVVTVPVKILVDEEEPARPGIWQRRLRARFEAASAILERHCRVRFQVAAEGTWTSNNATNDFFDALAEFEQKADPAPARIAVGFSSQWQMVKGRVHMAGTRGPLHSHILVREGSPQITEPERLEFLIHELGHYLGAAHSPEWQSVMRPVLGDKLAGRRDFKIQFDPVNTLAIAMINEEMRRSNLTQLSQLQYDTRRRLEQIYLELARTMPNDPAGMKYAMLMRTSETPLVAATKQVLQQIVHAAVENRALPVTAGTDPKQPTRREGDALTDYYVREAAKAAGALPGDVAPQALLLGLAVGLDDSNMLARTVGMGNLVQTVEPQSERTIRLAVLGKPTMHGRPELRQHFFGSAYLSATNGMDKAQTSALETELSNSQQPRGLSFKVIAADRAGIRFGKGVMDKRFTLRMVAAAFDTASFMPEIDSLPDAVTWKDLASQYGTKTDPRFLKQIHDIDDRILLLPGYRATGTVFGK